MEMGERLSRYCWYLAKERSLENQSEVSSPSYMILSIPSCRSPAIKVLLAIKVSVEGSVIDSVACLFPTIENLVTTVVSVILHENYMCMSAYREVSSAHVQSIE
jgi:hypothetical protein